MIAAPLALYAEVIKELIITWNYRANLVIELLTIAVLFIFISYFFGTGAIANQGLPAFLLGYLIWFYAAIAISSMSSNLLNEASVGTLEQLYMSPVPTWLLFVGRVIGTFLKSTIMVAIVGMTLMLVLRISLPVDAEAIPPFVLTMVGLFGFGYAIGGLTLIYKQITSVTNLVNNLLLFLNGALLPIQYFPEWLETTARMLPTTQGIDVLRKVVVDGASLSAVWEDGSMVFLTVQSVVFLLVGSFSTLGNVSRSGEGPWGNTRVALLPFDRLRVNGGFVLRLPNVT